MTSKTFDFVPEPPASADAVEALNAAVAGPGRFAKTAYRLRQGVPHEALLSFVALAHSRLVGSVRLTRVAIAGRPALLLGPLVVAPEFSGQGIGRALVRRCVDAARAAGHELIILVGDEPYYGPLGFKPLPGGPVWLPGPADPARILVAELKEGAAVGLAGAVTRAF